MSVEILSKSIGPGSRSKLAKLRKIVINAAKKRLESEMALAFRDAHAQGQRHLSEETIKAQVKAFCVRSNVLEDGLASRWPGRDVDPAQVALVPEATALCAEAMAWSVEVDYFSAAFPTFLILAARVFFAAGEHTQTIEYATTGLTFIEWLQADPDFQTDDEAYVNNLLFQMRFALFERAKAEVELENFENARLDLRAACALERELGNDLSVYPARYSRELLTTAMALNRRGKPRPLYTPAEIDDFNKEVQRGPYTPSLLVCSACGKASNEGRLSLCKGCDAAWYCGKPCQRANWREHKSACRSLQRKRAAMAGRNHVTMVSDNPESAEALEVRGYCFTSDPTGEDIIMRDPETGQLFECLSNFDVIMTSLPAQIMSEADNVSLASLSLGNNNCRDL
jgi:hypothetical protein